MMICKFEGGKRKAITISIYYGGKNGNAGQFASEMISAIRE